MNKDAQQVFEALNELSREGRQGTAAGAKAALARAFAAARAEGYAQAREQAAVKGEAAAMAWVPGLRGKACGEYVAQHIRAMQDERVMACGGCGHAHHDDNACPACRPGECIRSDA